MEIERECGYEGIKSFTLDSGIEVELNIKGTYIAKASIELEGRDTPYSCEYEITSVDLEDVEIESVFSDVDDDPRHYKLTEPEYKRLQREFWSIAEKDFEDYDLD